MSRSFQISLPPEGQPPLIFPKRCVCCGAPPQAESTLLINRLALRGRRQVPISLKYQIPHCERCARSTRIVFLAGCLPFGLGFVLAGGLAFFAVAFGASRLGLDDYGQPQSSNSLILGAAAGLVAGLAGAFIFEVAARAVLVLFLGRALWQAPLLAAQLLNDSDYVAGLTGKPDREARQLQLTFANAEVAREFEALNAAGPGGRR